MRGRASAINQGLEFRVGTDTGTLYDGGTMVTPAKFLPVGGTIIFGQGRSLIGQTSIVDRSMDWRDRMLLVWFIIGDGTEKPVAHDPSGAIFAAPDLVSNDWGLSASSIWACVGTPLLTGKGWDASSPRAAGYNWTNFRKQDDQTIVTSMQLYSDTTGILVIKNSDVENHYYQYMIIASEQVSQYVPLS